MIANLGFVIIGLLLVGMAITGSVLQRLPLSTAMLYILAGIALGPFGIGLIDLDPVNDAELIERLAEIAVIVSLFTAGLKLRLPLRDRRWWLSLRLAFVSMTVTVALVAVVAVVFLDFTIGLAILLGAILAPTDPVLASDVQVREPGDQDRLRFSLTSEAGLNDGTAFPFVMLGLGLIGLNELGDFGWYWITVDVVWSIVAGLGVGALLGFGIGQIVIYLRRVHKEAVGLDDFLAIGLIALSYGTALLIHSYGFLAVFAAGLAVRRIEARHTGDEAPVDVKHAALEVEPHEVATHPESAPAYMTEAVLAFNEQIDRIGALGILLLIGSMLSTTYLHPDAIWFVPLLLLVIRPFSVWLGLFGSHTNYTHRHMISWFGVRGIGSIYYLMYAIVHGVVFSDARELVALTFSVILVSVVVHGVSVTPLMNWYERHASSREQRNSGGQVITEPSSTQRRSTGAKALDG